jgi:hypothetical protein
VAGVPDRGGHGVRLEDVIAEVEPAGFRLVERRDEWEGHAERFCIVFTATPMTTTAPGPEPVAPWR